jgi:pyruvate dehydrogenase E2 component (dihydrolipoamide acetyltransferase)
MDILMPQLGETVAEGKITVWFKAIGDAVAPGDNLFEIETDKVSMEVPATAAGVIAEIRVAAGEVALVGAVVAVVAEDVQRTTEDRGRTTNDGEQIIDELRRTTETGQRKIKGGGWKMEDGTSVAPSSVVGPLSADIRPPSEPAAPRESGGKAGVLRPPLMLDPFREVRTPPRNYGPAKLASGVVVTPLARRLASEAGIDLGRLAPSGPHRRIVARDVETAIAAGAGAGTAAHAPAPSPDRVKALYEPGTYEEVPLDRMRRTIAARLTEATRIPQFHLTADVAIDRLYAVREEANAAALPDASGAQAFRLTVTDFVVKALALALKHVPAANAVWAEDCILRFMRCDVGVAVAIDGGLVTPVIRSAEAKSLLAISTQMRDLAARARTRRLNPAELVGGASAVSNLGMHGVREFAAILNPPQATIMAVGAAGRRPVETADGLRFAGQMTVTLTCDHRVVDGALGAELLGAFREFIEHPIGLML